MSGGGLHLPELSCQCCRRASDLSFIPQLYGSGQHPLVRLVKGKQRASVRLQITDVDDLPTPHYGAVFQCRPRLGGGARKAGKLPARRTYAHRQRQRQIRCGQCAGAVQSADQVIDGKGLRQADDGSDPIVVQKELAPVFRQGLLQQLLYGQRGQRITAAAADVGKGHRPFSPGKIDIQLRRPRPLRSRLHPSVQQVGVEQLPQHRQIFHITAAKQLHVPPFRTLPVQLCLQPPQYGGQLIGIDGLENVLRYIPPNGLLGILKIVKAGKNHKFRDRQKLCQAAAELQSIHKRHFDVGKDHIGKDLLRQFQRIPPVGGFSRQRKAKALPVHFPADTLADILFIVHQQHTVQLHSSAPSPFYTEYTTLFR